MYWRQERDSACVNSPCFWTYVIWLRNWVYLLPPKIKTGKKILIKKIILLLSKDTEIVRNFPCLWNWHNALQLNGFAKWLCKETFPPPLAWKLLLFLLTLLTSVWVHVFQLTSNLGECQKVTSVPWVTINLKIKRWSLKSSLSITKP